MISALSLHNSKILTKMATLKAGWMLAYLIGVPMWTYAFIENLNSWKSGALFIMMMIYWMGMIWFSFRKKRQLEREKELELWHKEQDKIERMNKKK